MLTGGPPFTATENLAVLHQQLHSEPLSPRARGARISPSLELLVLAMLAKDPAARPQTAGAVAARLRESLLDGVTETAPTRPQVLSGAAGTAGRRRVAGARGWVAGAGVDRGSSARWPMALALVAAVVVLVVAVTALSSGGGGRAPRSGLASKVTRRATGSYHEPVTQATPPPATTTAPPAPAPKKKPPPHPGPKGPDGGGPPGHDQKPKDGPKPPDGGG
jgi:hypothetical protein